MTSPAYDRSPHRVFAVLLVGLLVAACGDDGDDGMAMEDGGAVDADGGGMGDPDGGTGDQDGGMDDPDGGMTTFEPYTEEEVQQLFEDNGCTQSVCHDSVSPARGQDLTDFVPATVNVPADQSDLDRIEPGDHTQSYLWHKVNGTHRDPPASGSGIRMPRGGLPLSAEEIGRLAAYIDALPVEE